MPTKPTIAESKTIGQLIDRARKTDDLINIHFRTRSGRTIEWYIPAPLRNITINQADQPGLRDTPIRHIIRWRRINPDCRTGYDVFCDGDYEEEQA